MLTPEAIEALKAQGYFVTDVDKVTRASSADAVVAFQKANRLDVTGVVDAVTARLLSANPPRQAHTRQGQVLEVDLSRMILLCVQTGVVRHTLNVAGPGSAQVDRDGRKVRNGLPTGTFRLRARKTEGDSRWVFLPPFGFMGVEWVASVAETPGDLSINQLELDALVKIGLVSDGARVLVR